MKIIFLLSLIYTFILANQTQIVLGTFTTESIANETQNDVNKIINKDTKFQNFIDMNSLKTVSKKHGKYFIVTIEPFNDIVTTHSVLNRIKKTKYKDAYILKIFSQKTLKKEKTETIIIPEPEIIDDPLLMPEPDIKSIKVASLTQKSDINAEKEKKKDIVIKEKVSKRPTKELNVLETYFNEIIAAIAILILIVVYFMIKKSQQKQKDDFEDSTPVLNKKEVKKEVVKEVSVVEAAQEPEPIVMQEIVEAINFKALSGEEEGSFGVEESITQVQEIKITPKPKRTKRDVPPHSKITKENFKEFAGQKILVAEDNIINQKVISGLLADSGIEVTIADDGQFLLEILEKDSDFNFILMDAHMPRVDGFEATRRIRKNPNYDHIIIIALSGDTAPDDVRKMSEAGMEEHLEKPLKIEAMYNILYAYNDSTQIIPDEFVEIVITKELDTDKGLNICGDDVEFYHEILNEFVSTYSESPAKLQEFINHNEMQKADRYLLDLSGITANIGANNISKIASGLKEAIVNHEDKKYIELIKEYTKSLYDLLEDIKKYKNRE
ncbi:protein containing signal transduction response regulator receiver region domain [Sulfurimonas gotlandica GD1]|uniref:Protein containing signal transduction response regulator receiver region domain n=1 Tax=Sulfurimonas gotlandica (strain DSM 19862 / JCM 16533 / GD1) TaxID=929558 RepID=B6BNL5_SULGG|nr:response regulator [Sulfurimonas gotlandica]EDZ61236.1 response regulator receiver domain protein [Sulfurimonas gotlandica GD1]EHP28818.1 protein containing signal transduction response regulator receiver region domain [Sulfurimonas gotlandica GD1]